MTDNKMNAILDATPWRCLHCDFITIDRDEAAAHFGDRDDAEEFKPICKWWASLEHDARLEVLQDTIKQLNAEQLENMGHRTAIEGLEYQVGTNERCISSYKPFRDCRSIYDVFCLYDTMEGRALAAESMADRAGVQRSRDDAFEASAKIAERYECGQMAIDIRALKSV